MTVRGSGEKFGEGSGGSRGKVAAAGGEVVEEEALHRPYWRSWQYLCHIAAILPLVRTAFTHSLPYLMMTGAPYHL